MNQLKTKALDLKKSYRFSRFAYIHVVNGRFVIETPRSSAVVPIPNAGVFHVFEKLAEGIKLSELLDSIDRKLRPKISAMLEQCFQFNFLSEIQDDVSEEDTGSLQTWEFHDLLFHARSRVGRHSYDFGGTFRFGKKLQPLPAIKPTSSENAIPLYHPDLDQIEDYPFSLVLENRFSVREYASDPLTAKQLGEFLYRSARSVFIGLDEVAGETCHRVSASGGGIYPLEIYPIINECEGLKSGVYHYNPQIHCLEPVDSWSEKAKQILLDAKRATGLKAELPPVYFGLTARFRRNSWKYESISYSVILKDVGCLLQTFYLVATAMDLAPCALGSGNSDMFSEIIQTDYYQESTVGEFILGSKNV
jgi:SagB-type dehydrogenase family enzyme